MRYYTTVGEVTVLIYWSQPAAIASPVKTYELQLGKQATPLSWRRWYPVGLEIDIKEFKYAQRN
jgi:hypothetical protein